MCAVDVAVIGGGVIGASAACALARGGASVALIERDELGAHASRAAAGMLAPITESFAAVRCSRPRPESLAGTRARRAARASGGP
jgi:glycine/D-amino acid oxidase-like deaminating enzyme